MNPILGEAPAFLPSPAELLDERTLSLRSTTDLATNLTECNPKQG